MENIDRIREDWAKKVQQGRDAENIVIDLLNVKNVPFTHTMGYSKKLGKSILKRQEISNLLQNVQDKDRVMNLLETIKYGIPYFICLGDNNTFFFIEVKSNNSILRKNQASAIITLKEAGYEVLFFRFEIDS